jgi:hypothetical protein
MPEVWGILMNTKEKIEALLDKYFKAHQWYDGETDQTVDALVALVEAEKVEARIDEIHRMLGKPKKGEIGYTATKSRIKELRATLKGGKK